MDDNPSFRDAARDLLEREGLRVVGVAATGAEALLQAKEFRPEVVLVDITLADESGFDVAESLVAQDLAGSSAVILISTRSEADLADLIAASPAIGFLAKSDLSAQAIRRMANGRVA